MDSGGPKVLADAVSQPPMAGGMDFGTGGIRKSLAERWQELQSAGGMVLGTPKVLAENLPTICFLTEMGLKPIPNQSKPKKLV